MLDIGCGWGGLALYLAELCGARVTGITLSEQQLALARARAAEKGLADRIDVPSAGLSRRAGDNSTASSRSACSSMSASASTTLSSARCRALLDDNGVMLLHSIGRSEGPNITNPWIAKVHLPRRLHPGAVRGAAGGRARGPARHRHRNPAPALRRDAQGLARPLPRPPRGGRAALRRRVSPACGSSISRRPRWRSASRR